MPDVWSAGTKEADGYGHSAVAETKEEGGAERGEAVPAKQREEVRESQGQEEELRAQGFGCLV